jgi:ring-1,2-phenylacetyl-CoA epoxidase subunit PaaD
VSEGRTHLEIARARSGLGGGAPDAGRIRTAVEAIPDPELPVVTIGDLGMVHRVEVDPGAIRVTILPTFIGCPALELIRDAVVEGLTDFGRPVTVTTSFETPWTSERISAAGRAALLAAGIAPPADPDDVRCPYCASARVVMDSAFGPTQCRSLFYCRECRQPFEAMKPV